MPYITYIKKITGFMNNSIEITDNAQNHIANNLKKDKAKFFRITVSGGGCAGFQYKFEFENIKKNDDLINFFESLEEEDDVQNIYSNAKFI